MRDYSAELRAVHGWADEADRIALSHFAHPIAVERKADGSPVTVADRGIEDTIRRAIERDFPGDAMLGEETGSSRGGGSRRWIVDPIDGTKNFVRGIPLFATLVALEEDGELVLGFASAPAMRTRWWGTRGHGAFRDGAPIRVSAVHDVSAAHIASGGLETARRAGLLEGLLALAERVERHRSFGDFYGHMLVAQGSMEAMIEPEVGAWDIAAPKIILEEAGGTMTTLGGENRFDGGNCLSSNGRMHETMLRTLAGDVRD